MTAADPAIIAPAGDPLHDRRKSRRSVLLAELDRVVSEVERVVPASSETRVALIALLDTVRSEILRLTTEPSSASTPDDEFDDGTTARAVDKTEADPAEAVDETEAEAEEAGEDAWQELAAQVAMVAEITYMSMVADSSAATTSNLQ
ncbi:MAG: hypothetical protein AAGC55_02230 [Myxococcota bacterium]